MNNKWISLFATCTAALFISACGGGNSDGGTPAIAPAPTVTSVSPDPVIGSTTEQTLSISGTGFTNKPSMTLSWAGNSSYAVPDAKVTYVSSTSLVLKVTTSAVADNWSVTVVNPDHQASNALTFKVVAPSVVTVSDADFAAWSSFSFVTDDPNTVTPGPGTSVSSAARVVTGGNPDAYFGTIGTVNLGDRLWTGGVKSDFLYDPAQSGSVVSISVNADGTLFTNGATGWKVVVEQGGVRFYSVVSGVFSGGWSNASLSGLTADSFDSNPLAGWVGAVSLKSPPDFGSAASPLKFGVVFEGTVIGGSSVTHGAGIDNVVVTIVR
jgi:hypothetical protein